MGRRNVGHQLFSINEHYDFGILKIWHINKCVAFYRNDHYHINYLYPSECDTKLKQQQFKIEKKPLNVDTQLSLIKSKYFNVDTNGQSQNIKSEQVELLWDWIDAQSKSDNSKLKWNKKITSNTQFRYVELEVFKEYVNNLYKCYQFLKQHSNNNIEKRDRKTMCVSLIYYGWNDIDVWNENNKYLNKEKYLKKTLKWKESQIVQWENYILKPKQQKDL